MVGRIGVIVLAAAALSACGSPATVADASMNSIDGSTNERVVVFHSDWSTATGTSEAALRDTGKDKPWIQWTDQNAEVVPAAGLGFPSEMANVFVTRANNRSVVLAFGADPAYFGADAVSYFPPPAIGERLSYRMYVRCDVPDSYAGGSVGDLAWHPWQSTYAPGDWVGNLITFQNGTWSWRIAAQEQDNVWPYDQWGSNTALALGSVYRLEWQFHRTSETTWQLHMRVYDTDDTTLLHDDTSIRSQQPSNVTTLAERNAGGHELTFVDVATLPGLTVGVNGFQNDELEDFPFDFTHTGGVAICTGDWCGPYANGI